MYDEPEACDEDQVEIEATACHMYCDLGPDALTEPCRAALIEVYNCIVDQQLLYECPSLDDSPQSVDQACEGEWETAHSC
jgi:hypothetical protein